MLRSTSPRVPVTRARYSAMDDSASGGMGQRDTSVPDGPCSATSSTPSDSRSPIALVTFHRSADFSCACCCARLSSANDLGGIVELHTGEMGKAKLYQRTGHVASIIMNVSS